MIFFLAPSTLERSVNGRIKQIDRYTYKRNGMSAIAIHSDLSPTGGLPSTDISPRNQLRPGAVKLTEWRTVLVFIDPTVEAREDEKNEEHDIRPQRSNGPQNIDGSCEVERDPRICEHTTQGH
jgi:hypothetical protein